MNRSFCCMATSTLLLAVISTSISAQPQRWEHNLYEGVGVVNKFEDNDDQKTAFHVGYGLNYYITPNWSVMPGVALRFKALGKDNGNSGNCASTYIDVPLLVQYHFGGDKRKGMVVECGPVVSFLAHSNTYDGKYWNTWNPYEGEKCTSTSTWEYAQPSITRQDIGASACSPMSGSLTSSANFQIDPTPRFSTTNTMP